MDRLQYIYYTAVYHNIIFQPITYFRVIYEVIGDNSWMNGF